MKKVFSIGAIYTLIVLAAGLYAAWQVYQWLTIELPENPISEFQPQSYQQVLDNGLTLNYLADGRQQAQVRLDWQGGFALEPEQVSGIDRLLWQLMWNGSVSSAYPKGLNAWVFQQGGQWQAEYGLRSRHLSFTLPSVHLAEFLPKLAETIASPDLSAKAIALALPSWLAQLKAEDNQILTQYNEIKLLGSQHWQPRVDNWLQFVEAEDQPMQLLADWLAPQLQQRWQQLYAAQLLNIRMSGGTISAEQLQLLSRIFTEIDAGSPFNVTAEPMTRQAEVDFWQLPAQQDSVELFFPAGGAWADWFAHQRLGSPLQVLQAQGLITNGSVNQDGSLLHISLSPTSKGQASLGQLVQVWWQFSDMIRDYALQNEQLWNLPVSRLPILGQPQLVLLSSNSDNKTQKRIAIKTTTLPLALVESPWLAETPAPALLSSSTMHGWRARLIHEQEGLAFWTWQDHQLGSQRPSLTLWFETLGDSNVLQSQLHSVLEFLPKTQWYWQELNQGQLIHVESNLDNLYELFTLWRTQVALSEAVDAKVLLSGNIDESDALQWLSSLQALSNFKSIVAAPSSQTLQDLHWKLLDSEVSAINWQFGDDNSKRSQVSYEIMRRWLGSQLIMARAGLPIPAIEIDSENAMLNVELPAGSKLSLSLKYNQLDTLRLELYMQQVWSQVLEQLDKLDATEFASLKQALIAELSAEPIVLADLDLSQTHDLIQGEDHFNSRDQLLRAIEDLSYEGFIGYWIPRLHHEDGNILKQYWVREQDREFFLANYRADAGFDLLH